MTIDVTLGTWACHLMWSCDGPRVKEEKLCVCVFFMCVRVSASTPTAACLSVWVGLLHFKPNQWWRHLNCSGGRGRGGRRTPETPGGGGGGGHCGPDERRWGVVVGSSVLKRARLKRRWLTEEARGCWRRSWTQQRGRLGERGRGVSGGGGRGAACGVWGGVLHFDLKGEERDRWRSVRRRCKQDVERNKSGGQIKTLRLALCAVTEWANSVSVSTEAPPTCWWVGQRGYTDTQCEIHRDEFELWITQSCITRSVVLNLSVRHRTGLVEMAKLPVLLLPNITEATCCFNMLLHVLHSVMCSPAAHVLIHRWK